MGILGKTAKALGFFQPKTVKFEDAGPQMDFSARNQDGKEVKLSGARGKFVLLYFYPKDDTKGCTKQACDLRDEFADIKKKDAIVYGISRQGEEMHRQFRARHRLPFDLLVDEDGALARQFGIELMPILGYHRRQSILIGRDGRVVRKYLNVDPGKHVEMVLHDLEALQSGQ